MIKIWTYLLVAVFILQGCAKSVSTKEFSNLSLVPYPEMVSLKNDSIVMLGPFKAIDPSQLLYATQALLDEAQLGLKENKETSITYVTDTLLVPEQYRLSIAPSGIEISGRDLQAHVWGTQTLLQLDDGQQLPLGEIIDQPAYSYRGLVVDVASHWHDVSMLKQLISLCSYYKINHLQLRLTYDDIVLFPSTTFWQLASKPSYNRDQLYELNRFAHARGVVLVPEIMITGHSARFVQTLPQWFGLEDPSTNPNTINMGNERVYHALDKLFTDVADAFPFSPYIHMGGGKGSFEGFLDDKGVQKYMKVNKLETLDDLYDHFIEKTSAIIKSKGKTPVVWNDFDTQEEMNLPTDVIIMSSRSSTEGASTILNDGYSIIYGNWTTSSIGNDLSGAVEKGYNEYDDMWKIDQTIAKRHKGVLGGFMAVSDQDHSQRYASLKRLLPVMAERLWSSETSGYENFSIRNRKVTSKWDEKYNTITPLDSTSIPN